MENTEMIGNVSIERWKKAFAVANIFDKDAFGDILFFELYPTIDDEVAEIDEEDEDAICDVYNEKWEFAYEAFEKVFGVKINEAYGMEI